MSFLDRFRWWWLPLVFVVGVAGGYLSFQASADPGEPGGAETKAGRAGGALSSASSPSAADPRTRLGKLERIASVEDVSQLAALCEEIVEGGDAHTMMRALMDRWIELDAAGGFEFFDSAAAAVLPDSLVELAPSEYCGRWALADPDSAARAAIELEDKKRSHVAKDRISSALAAHRPRDFFRLLVSGTEGMSPYWIKLAARSLTHADPAAAVAVLDELSENRVAEVSPEVASAWANRDPEAALSWVREMEDKAVQIKALDAIAVRLMLSDPHRAAELFNETTAFRISIREEEMKLPEEFRAGRYTWSHAAQMLAESDPAAAIAWVTEHFPDGAGAMLRQLFPNDAIAAVEVVAALPERVLKEDGKLPSTPPFNWRPIDVEIALERLAEIENPTTRESLHAWLLGVEAEDNPHAAMNRAVEDLSDAENRGYVLSRGMMSWARRDFVAASVWLSQRPAGTETDHAIIGFLRAAPRSELGAALTWAAAISDEDLRVTQMSFAYKNWKVADEAAARAAMDELDLSGEERAKLKLRGVDLWE